MDYTLEPVRWETKCGKWQVNANPDGYELIHVIDDCKECGFFPTIDSAIEMAKKIDSERKK